MKDSYHRRVGDMYLAVLDVSMFGLNTAWIHRLNVPASFRDKGIAREMMRELINDADLEGCNLALVINASGRPQDPDGEALAIWYESLGFVSYNGVYIRSPAFPGTRPRSDRNIRLAEVRAI